MTSGGFPPKRLTRVRDVYPPRRAGALAAVGDADDERPLTPAQKAVSGFQPGYFDDIGLGFGMSVRTQRTHLGPWPVSYPRLASAGSYGWPGRYGTGWYNDPAEDMITILMIQRAPAPAGLPILFDFWTAAYQAIDD